jgi:hypothetical protein
MLKLEAIGPSNKDEDLSPLAPMRPRTFRGGLAGASQGPPHYFFGGVAGSVDAGGPSEFHVSQTYSHLPSFFLETERYFPVSIT